MDRLSLNKVNANYTVLRSLWTQVTGTTKLPKGVAAHSSISVNPGELTVLNAGNTVATSGIVYDLSQLYSGSGANTGIAAISGVQDFQFGFGLDQLSDASTGADFVATLWSGTGSSTVSLGTFTAGTTLGSGTTPYTIDLAPSSIDLTQPITISFNDDAGYSTYLSSVYLTITSGSAIRNSVAEPGTAALFGLGIAALGLRRRRG